MQCEFGPVVTFPLQHQVEQGVILVLDHPFHSECRHANVDKDDRLCPVCQQEWGLAGRDTFGSPISPKHFGEYLRPFAFSFAQNFAQVDEESEVADFGLAVILRIPGRGESMCDFVLVTETHHFPAGEVRSVVGDNDMGEPKAA